METKKEVMEYLYGEKSGVIAGLESTMAFKYEELIDIHQPSLWPASPLDHS